MRVLFMNLGAMMVALLLQLAGRTAAGESSRPLIVVQFSEDALNRSLNEPIERESRVDENVLGTRAVGLAQTRGLPRVVLVENSEGASFKVTFQGETVSRTAGHHPPIVIHSRAITEFRAERLLQIDQLEPVVSGETSIDAKTGLEIENITTSRRGLVGRLVLRRAWSEVAHRRGAAEQFAQETARQRIAEAFDSALEARLAKLEKRVALRLLVAAILPHAATPAYRSVTQGGYLNVAVFAEAPEVRKVPIRLPDSPVGEQPILVWVHQDVIGQNLDTALGSLSAFRHFVSIPVFGIEPARNLRFKSSPGTSAGEWYVIPVGVPGN